MTETIKGEDHIPCIRLTVEFNSKIEAVVVEINPKKGKWLITGSYCPYKDMIFSFLNNIGNKLNDFYFTHENIILIGDFNSEMSEVATNTFCITYNLECLIREPTCFKNIDNPSCIDLIKPFCFRTLLS